MGSAAASDQQVLDLCDEIWKWRLQESPELATFCGFHQYDHLWDDISPTAYAKRESCVHAFLKRALVLDVTTCSRNVALSHSLLHKDLVLYIKGVPFPSLLMPLNYLEGIHLNCSKTFTFMRFDKEEDFDMYIARLKALPIRILQVIDILKEGVKEGIVQFSCSMQRVPEQIDVFLKCSNLDELEILKPFSAEHKGIPLDKLSSYQKEAKGLVMSDIFPAFAKLKSYLEEEYSKAWRPQEGISSLKNGGAWYQQCLDFHLTCSMTPQEVHDIGLREVARIQSQILQLAEREGFGQTLPEIRKSFAGSQEGYFNSEDEVMIFVRDLCYNKIRPNISRVFKNLPGINMKIEEAPMNTPSCFYVNGTVDGSRDGALFVNNHKLENCYPYEYPTLCLHIGEPGHHLQSIYALAASATHLPDFRRYCENSKHYLSPMNFSFNTAYVKGWGVYCEALGEELGLFENALDLLGRYGFGVFHACRLVVDTGLHAFGWSKEKTLHYMLENCLCPPGESANEVERYITWPGQACAYKIGEMKIWQLRQKAEKELGASFDIREFHHCILSCGAVPLDTLADIVDEFIQNSKTATN